MWARPVAAAFGVIAVAIAMFTIYRTQFGRPNTIEFIKKDAAYQRVAHKRVAELIARKHPQARILLVQYEYQEEVVNDEKPRSIVRDAIMKGLEEGLAGTDASIVKIASVRREFEDYEEVVDQRHAHLRRTGDELSAHKLDTLMEQNPECNVVLLLTGLPQDMKRMDFWERDDEERPTLYITGSVMLGELVKTIEQGYIGGILHSKPGNSNYFEEPVPEDEDEAFNRRYILVTAESMDELSTEFPQLFSSSR